MRKTRKKGNYSKKTRMIFKEFKKFEAGDYATWSR